MTKTIVITGSTRGIGFGVARAFVEAGCNVVVSGRSAQAVERAVSALGEGGAAGRVAGQACDVTSVQQLQGLWEAAQARFGQVDIWINNAGIAHRDIPFWELPSEQVGAVVETNLTGLMYGCSVAAKRMLAQGGGFIYNLEGFGSTGMLRRGMSVYGSTKAAVHYFTRALAKDLEGTPVKAASVAPGMVMTDLVAGEYVDRPAEWERAKRIFNIIADNVETVAPWMAQQVLANERNGARIAWLTPAKLAWRFASARFSKRDLFANRPQPEP